MFGETTHVAAPSASDCPEYVCRICFETSKKESLISPCGCKGTQEFVHPACLSKWQQTVVLSLRGSTERQATEQRHKICQACKKMFDSYPKSRSDVFRSVIGDELSDLGGRSSSHCQS